MRRRALLAASVPMWEDENLPPESTTFEFPLYLNTRIIEKTSDFLYRSRESDDISNQLLQFYYDNYRGSGVGGGNTGTGISSPNWPKNFFINYPVFIDGYQVENVSAMMGGTAEGIRTNKDYGDYAEIFIYLDEFELCVEGYN